MVRIGRQIPHFEQVDQSSIRADFSEDQVFRYLLQMKYAPSLYDGGRTKKAAVVMKNPSSADHRAADATIRKVETYVYHKLPEVLELNILNLFALRATDATDLNKVFLKEGYEAVCGDRNDRVISEVAAQMDYLVVAWGNRSGIDLTCYQERVRKVKEIISGVASHRVFEVKGPRENLFPLHGLMWGYDYPLEPYVKMKEED